MSIHGAHAGSLPAFGAEDAARIGLGAYYNAIASCPSGGPELVGAWMLEISRKLGADPATAVYYVEIIRRWGLDENADFTGQKMQGLPPSDDRADNRSGTGVDNA